jgi:Spy/CpxP family protein refolding chaperone
LRKLSLIPVFIVAATLLFSARYVSADDGMGKSGMKGMGDKMAMVNQVLMMADYLGLSTEQINKLTDLDIDSQINTIKNQAEVEVTELELRKLMSSYNSDRTAIDSKVDKLYDAKKINKKNMIDTHFKVMSIITKEQYEKLKELMMKMGRMSEALKQHKPMEPGMDMPAQQQQQPAMEQKDMMQEHHPMIQQEEKSEE